MGYGGVRLGMFWQDWQGDAGQVEVRCDTLWLAEACCCRAGGVCRGAVGVSRSGMVR